MASDSNLESTLLGELIPIGKHDMLVDSSEKYTPQTKHTVGYIVSAVLLNEEGKVLMIQEAKPSCRGLWYLPAGRMEPNESLTDACEREVLEETGLQCRPITLLSIDSNGPLWFRFNFAAVATGGELKTTETADEESLQAGWYTVEEIQRSLRLRAKDVLPMIDLAVNYRKTEEDVKHAALLPHVVPHKKLFYKYVFYQSLNQGKDYYVMRTSHNRSQGYPIIVVHTHDYNIYTTTGRMLKEVIKMKHPDNKLVPHFRGILAVEFSGKPKFENDGFCITLLVEVKMSCADQQELFKLKSKLEWSHLNDSEKRTLEKKIAELGSVYLSCY